MALSAVRACGSAGDHAGWPRGGWDGPEGGLGSSEAKGPITTIQTSPRAKARTIPAVALVIENDAEALRVTVKGILDRAHARATALLREHWGTVARLAEALLARETLERPEIEKLLAERDTGTEVPCPEERLLERGSAAATGA